MTLVSSGIPGYQQLFAILFIFSKYLFQQNDSCYVEYERSINHGYCSKKILNFLERQIDA